MNMGFETEHDFRLALNDWPLALGDDLLSELPGADSSSNKSASEGKSPRKIMIVDDERLLADTTAAILRRFGFEVKVAYDGWEALNVLPDFRPDYVLTDVLMPKMNGMELAIAVTKMFPGMKIMLYSGQAGVSSILEEGKAKGYEFPLLAKPVHPSKVIESLQKLDSSRS